MAIDDEQAYAGAIAGATGRPRRDDQLVGPRRTNHRRLCAAQDKMIPLASRRRSDVVKIVTRSPLGPSQRPYGAAVHDLRKKRLALLG